MKNYIHIILLLILPAIGFAQQAKTLHQTFEIEEVERLNFSLYGEIEVEKWEGNTLLTETKIEVHDASKGIFNHYLKEGRYEIVLADKPSEVAPAPEAYALNDDYFSEDETTSSDTEDEYAAEYLAEIAAEKAAENAEAGIEAEAVPAEPEVGGVYLTSKDNERKPIRTRTGECLEIVKIKIFIPEDFNKSGDNSYSRVLPIDDTED